MKKLVLRLILAIGIVVLTAGGITGYAKTKSPAGKTLIYAAEFEYDLINPILDVSNADGLIFRGLMKFDADNVIRKDIAASFTVSPDGLEYDFKLRHDVKFHDGTNLTAEDVVFTINSILDKKVNSKLKTDFSLVKSVTAVNPFEVKIGLKKSFTPFLDKLTIGIVPRHAFKGQDINTADFNHHPIGAGPYRFAKWEKGKSLTLKSFKRYYGNQAKINTIIFKFVPDGNMRAIQLETGEVDLALLEPSQVEKAERTGKIKVYKVPAADYRCMMYNMNNEIWQDVKVRKAFNYAVDRQAVVSGILLGYGITAYSPLQLNPFRNDSVEKYRFNLAKANELLDQSGWKKGRGGIRKKNGKQLAFTLSTPITDEVRLNIANYLADQFKKIGAAVKVEALDWSVINIAKTDAFILGWGSPYDADDYTYKLFHSQAPGIEWNFGGYSNQKVDDLLERGRIVRSRREREKIYQQLQRELAEDPPYNFIVYLKALYGVNKKVTGIKEKVVGHHGVGFLWNIEEWSLQ
jgi:peptide/nickel transport system substrate-binding protein